MVVVVIVVVVTIVAAIPVPAVVPVAVPIAVAVVPKVLAAPLARVFEPLASLPRLPAVFAVLPDFATDPFFCLVDLLATVFCPVAGLHRSESAEQQEAAQRRHHQRSLPNRHASQHFRLLGNDNGRKLAR
jgi:hypothetical protein